MKIKPCLSKLDSSFKIDLETLFQDLDRIRQTNPVIHNITNLVVTPITANLLLALGASPLMAHAEEELIEILHLSHALVLNIGTLDEHWISAMTKAQKIALDFKTPVVLDPVGVGASHYRTGTAKKILERGVTLVRGNASEIMALLDPTIKTKGVDSTQASHDALEAAKLIAEKYKCAVVVSGKTDLIVTKNQHAMLDFGTPLFTKVVGMGCSLTAIIASFLTVNPDPFSASKHAMALFGMAGELAEKKAQGPGSFYTQLLDTLYSLKQTDIEPFFSKSPLAL